MQFFTGFFRILHHFPDLRLFNGIREHYSQHHSHRICTGCRKIICRDMDAVMSQILCGSRNRIRGHHQNFIFTYLKSGAVLPYRRTDQYFLSSVFYLF